MIIWKTTQSREQYTAKKKRSREHNLDVETRKKEQRLNSVWTCPQLDFKPFQQLSIFFFLRLEPRYATRCLCLIRWLSLNEFEVLERCGLRNFLIWMFPLYSTWEVYCVSCKNSVNSIHIHNTYNSWIHICVTKKTGCGISPEYKKYTEFTI